MANEYRLKSDGSIKTKQELIADNKNTSFPKVWNDDIHEALGVDVVFETAQPTPSEAYKQIVRDGTEQNSKDQWVQKWKEQDMFADTTDDDGVKTTKAKHEEAYQAKLDANAAESARNKRNNLLAATDWLGMSDVTMSTAWATYRQALRDVPGQSGFPNSITWPDEP
tara:strand:+ start:556 stop:1056 length:501 start_codon:yes stop_codon:yes gene_type:complete